MELYHTPTESIQSSLVETEDDRDRCRQTIVKKIVYFEVVPHLFWIIESFCGFQLDEKGRLANFQRIYEFPCRADFEVERIILSVKGVYDPVGEPS